MRRGSRRSGGEEAARRVIVRRRRDDQQALQGCGRACVGIWPRARRTCWRGTLLPFARGPGRRFARGDTRASTRAARRKTSGRGVIFSYGGVGWTLGGRAREARLKRRVGEGASGWVSATRALAPVAFRVEIGGRPILRPPSPPSAAPRTTAAISVTPARALDEPELKSARQLAQPALPTTARTRCARRRAREIAASVTCGARAARREGEGVMPSFGTANSRPRRRQFETPARHEVIAPSDRSGRDGRERGLSLAFPKRRRRE